MRTTVDVVLDASAAVELLLASALGGDVDRALGRDPAIHVPELFAVEVLAAIRGAERRKELVAARAAAAVDDLRRSRTMGAASAGRPGTLSPCSRQPSRCIACRSMTCTGWSRRACSTRTPGSSSFRGSWFDMVPIGAEHGGAVTWLNTHFARVGSPAWQVRVQCTLLVAGASAP